MVTVTVDTPCTMIHISGLYSDGTFPNSNVSMKITEAAHTCKISIQRHPWQRRRKVSRSGTANKSCACAEVIHRTLEGVASRHAQAGCGVSNSQTCIPGWYTPGDVSESEAEPGCVVHAL